MSERVELFASSSPSLPSLSFLTIIRLCSQFYFRRDEISQINATIRCEAPNQKLYEFKGSIQGKGADSTSLDQGITINNILLRGTIVRNTEKVYAVIIYTGHDTRLMQNCVDPPSKRSLLDRKVDTMLYLMYVPLPPRLHILCPHTNLSSTHLLRIDSMALLVLLGVVSTLYGVSLQYPVVSIMIVFVSQLLPYSLSVLVHGHKPAPYLLRIHQLDYCAKNLPEPLNQNTDC